MIGLVDVWPWVGESLGAILATECVPDQGTDWGTERAPNQFVRAPNRGYSPFTQPVRQCDYRPGGTELFRNSALTCSSVFTFPPPASNCQKAQPFVFIFRPVIVARAFSAAVEQVR